MWHSDRPLRTGPRRRCPADRGMFHGTLRNGRLILSKRGSSHAGRHPGPAMTHERHCSASARWVQGEAQSRRHNPYPQQAPIGEPVSASSAARFPDPTR
jgi:hypothetical protein